MVNSYCACGIKSMVNELFHKCNFHNDHAITKIMKISTTNIWSHMVQSLSLMNYRSYNDVIELAANGKTTFESYLSHHMH